MSQFMYYMLGLKIKLTFQRNSTHKANIKGNMSIFLIYEVVEIHKSQNFQITDFTSASNLT